MVASENNRSSDLTFADGLIERKGDLRTSFAVGIKDTGLRTDNEVVASGLFYPPDVVHHLALYLFRCICHYVAEYACCNGIGFSQVFRLFRHADPTERSESVVKEKRTHDVLDIRRVAETSVFAKNVSTCA